MLNIITGRQGSGKTYMIRNLSAESALNLNGNTIIIVPEQFSFETERQMLKILGNEKINNIEVLSFSRLAERLLADSNRMPKQIADDGTKAILMSMAIENLQDNLSVYLKYKKSPALLNELLSFYGEMKKCCITPDEMSQMAQSVKRKSFQNKLSELSMIFDLYESMLNEKFCDEAEYLNLLYDLLCENKFFKGKNVFVDGFSGFSKQEYNILERIIEDSNEVYVTFCCDTTKSNNRYEFFYNSQTEINKLKNIAKKCNAKIAPEIRLNVNRKYKAEPLNVLQENLFLDNDFKYFENTDSISLVPCRTMADECDSVAAEIKRLVRCCNYRYRDIAVIERSEGTYKNELLSSFRNYGIDCFEDSRQPVMTQPLMVFMETLFSILIDGFQTENVLRFLKTGLYGFTVEEVAMIEDYCLAWQITPSKWKEEWTENPSGFGVEFKDSDRENLQKLNELREKIVAPILKLKNNITEQNGETISKSLFKFLRTNKIDENLKTFVSNLNKNEETELSLLQDRIWKILIGIFDSLYSSIGKTEISVKRYSELFKILSSSKDLGQIPTGLDQVILGSADRIRATAPKIVFIVGANTGVFPANCSGGVLLNDSERCELMENGAEIISNLEYNSVSEKFIEYRSLSLATERLYISFSNMTNDSESLTESEIVSEIKRIFTNYNVINFDTLRKIESPRTAFRAYATERKKQSQIGTDLFEYFRVNGTESQKNMIKKISKDTFEITDENIATELFNKNMYISASKTEAFYKCPFEYFCQYGLNAKPPREATMDPAQTGTLIHFVLEKFFTEYKKDEFLNFEDDEKIRIIDLIVDQYVEDKLGGYNGKMNSFIRSIELCKKSLFEIINRLIDEFRQSEFQVVDCELHIDNDGDIAPYKIVTEDGSTAQIIGYVDRVDAFKKPNGDGTYIRIVDYKTGGKDFKLSDIFAGLNMQMLIYLFAIMENGGKKYGDVLPAGILYYQAKDKRAGRSDSSRNSTPEEIQKDVTKKLRMSGMVADSVEVISAMEKNCGGIYIPASIDKKGNVKGEVISFKALNSLKEKVDGIISKMVTDLHSGYIDAYPIDKVCDYCKYRDVCKREADGKVREFESMSHGDALKTLIREEVEEDEINS